MSLVPKQIVGGHILHLKQPLRQSPKGHFACILEHENMEQMKDPSCFLCAGHVLLGSAS